MLLTLYARGEDPVGLGRVHERARTSAGAQVDSKA